MTVRQPRYSMEEHARRGTELYDGQIRPQVEIEAANHGKIVALDIDSGDFEIADEALTACELLLVRHPDAQIWCVRIGYPGVYRFGPRVRADKL